MKNLLNCQIVICYLFFSCHVLAKEQVNTSALVLIEYQNEWVSPKGTLRNLLVKNKKAFAQAISQSQQLLAKARQHQMHIVHVTLKPDANYQIFGNAQFGLRAAIKKAKTWQGDMANIHPNFQPKAGEFVISERSGASAFAGSSLDSYLRNNNITTLYLAGFATHVCVESTLREAHDKGYTTYVVTDATGAFTQQQQTYFEDEILHHFGKGILVEAFGAL
ncbi:isochorismatase family cysteine hydrolase [Pseudoalteromonas spongiae]|uniref:isochorismatase family cysteine hydrolase n=1 Tax=Pseudoalteromonas spongiae TaxID=298657 RepID=UPI00110B7B95|nr:isochorismatase family cysteine hydrolase [Pseudoalteromonas spongiae]TMO84315.1 cysteine hydrolase [Pseudoalteromonas spongiae]